MIKTKLNKLAGFALALCIAFCVCATVGINLTKKYLTASAETAKYTVTENFGSYKVSQDSPVTVKLTGINAGQYCIKLSVISATEMGYFYDMIATVGGESVFLTYNSSVDAFVGVIKVDSNDEDMILSIISTDPVEVSVDIDNLYLGIDNEYRLSGVQIAAYSAITANLNTEAGNYNVAVELDYMENPYEGTLYALVGNGTPVALTRTEDYMPFTGMVTVGENDILMIINQCALDITASVSISEVIEYCELPVSATLEMGMPVAYKYTADTTGYKYINVTSAEEGVYTELSVTFKASLEDFEEISISEENYPIYVEAGAEYYVELLLMEAYNDGEMVGTATVNIATGNWKAPTITPDVAYSVPVTAYGRDAVAMNLMADAGTYNLILFNMPYLDYWEGVVVTAHIGVQEIYLTADSNYATTVTLTGNTTIFLTTSADDSTAVTLFIETPKSIDKIIIREPTEINIPSAGVNEYGYYDVGRAVYYFEGYSEFYEITLEYLNGAMIEVKSSASDLPIVNIGETSGSFKVRDGITILEFINYSEMDVAFIAIVDYLAGDYDLKIGAVNVIDIKAGLTAYYFEGLVAGTYDLTVSNLPIGATVSIDGEEIALDSYGKAVVSISDGQDNIGKIVTVMFTSGDAAKITLILMPQNIMTVDNVFTITTSGPRYYVAYYMYLEAGTYSIQLNTPKDLYVVVIADNDLTITYGTFGGIFVVEKTGFVALRFACFTYGAQYTFNVFVSGTAGEMKLGEAMDVSMTSNDIFKTYRLTGLVSGEYNIALSNDAVKVYADGNLLKGNTFSIYGDSCTITFMYNGVVKFTAKVTPVNVLEADETNTVTIGYWEYSKTYFMELEAGSYNIVLDLPEGVSIQVTINGKVVIPFGGDEADFTISADEAGYVQITFETSSFEEVTFDVEIYNA